jgi:predicted nuclease of restriction endonuclease-like (RecB) superfamily
MNEIIKEEYNEWFAEIKSRIQSTQVKADLSTNKILIEFYWDLGLSIINKQKQSNWGDKLLDKMSSDLKKESPLMNGFSVRNLKYSRSFYSFYSNNLIGQQLVAQLKELADRKEERAEDILNDISDSDKLEIVQRLVAQIPWSHNIHVFTKAKDINEAIFYITKTIENNWGRDALAIQIKSNLYERQGKAITNFKNTKAE